jgi:Zn-finger nucleic acid-binding protein
MALLCPQCAAEMKEVKATATTGYLLALDQCPRCGGIWTDRWEVYPLSTATVEGLDDVDATTLHAPRDPAVAAPALLACPRCRARLDAFKDPTLPPDARIERCSNCEGMWFNRGELRRFKSRGGHRAPLINEAELGHNEAESGHLEQAATGTVASPTVSRLDDAMRVSAEDSPDDVRGELTAGAVWLVVRAALRLLLHI